MIHNFKSEIKKQDIEIDIKEFLLDLYKAEERGYSDPLKKPTTTFYENELKKYFEKTAPQDFRDDE